MGEASESSALWSERDLVNAFTSFYTTYLVPVFATVAFLLTCYREWKGRTRMQVKVRDGHFRAINRSQFPVYVNRWGYISGDWTAVVATGESGIRMPDPKVDRGAFWDMPLGINDVLSHGLDRPDGRGGALPGHGWWIALQSGEFFTTLPWWRFDLRARFWRKDL